MRTIVDVGSVTIRAKDWSQAKRDKEVTIALMALFATKWQKGEMTAARASDGLARMSQAVRDGSFYPPGRE